VLEGLRNTLSIKPTQCSICATLLLINTLFCKSVNNCQDILYKGTATNTIFNCNSSFNNRTTHSTGNIEITDIQEDSTFSGRGSFSSEVSGFLVEEKFDITGHLSADDTLTGTAKSSAFIDGDPAGSGVSSFAGQINVAEIAIKFPQQNLGVDNCKSSGTSIAVIKQ